jgi:hypothetical protein
MAGAFQHLSRRLAMFAPVVDDQDGCHASS